MQDTLQASEKKYFPKNTPEKLWNDKGTVYGGIFQTTIPRKNIEVYPTRSETKAAFAERAIQSLKHKTDRYREDHGQKFFHKLPQFVSKMNSRLNRSFGKSPRYVNNTDFLSILYNRHLTR